LVFTGAAAEAIFGASGSALLLAELEVCATDDPTVSKKMEINKK